MTKIQYPIFSKELIPEVRSQLANWIITARKLESRAVIGRLSIHWNNAMHRTTSRTYKDEIIGRLVILNRLLDRV